MIQVTIPAGVSSATVHGLHQWDYGRQLQIKADGLDSSLLEVHFECPGMKEAEVRVTQLVDGVPTVSIPDRCLEQSAPIRAWVCLVDGTSGRTALEVTLTVTPRLKPSAAGTAELEEEAGNKYDQLFGLMNEAYDAIEACKNVEANADEAQAAANTSVASASQAQTAATSAAQSATSAKASADSVADSALALANCFNKKDALIEVGTEGDTEIFYTGLIPTKKAFFYAFCVNTTENKTVSLGMFVWNGTDPVWVQAPVGGYGLRVSLVSTLPTSLEGRATLLCTPYDGNTVELTPRPSNMALYIQRLTN